MQESLEKFSPFQETNSLDSVRIVLTRVHGSWKVNVDTTVAVGFNILSDVLTKDMYCRLTLQN